MEQLIKKFWEETANLMQLYRKEGDERAVQGIVDCRILISRIEKQIKQKRNEDSIGINEKV